MASAGTVLAVAPAVRDAAPAEAQGATEWPKSSSSSTKAPKLCAQGGTIGMQNSYGAGKAWTQPGGFAGQFHSGWIYLQSGVTNFSWSLAMNASSYDVPPVTFPGVVVGTRLEYGDQPIGSDPPIEGHGFLGVVQGIGTSTGTSFFQNVASAGWYRLVLNLDQRGLRPEPSFVFTMTYPGAPTCGSDSSEIACVCNPASGLVTSGSASAADPVLTNFGNVVESATDLVVPSRGGGLTVGRSYSSLQAGTAGDFGYGGFSSFGWRVKKDTPATGQVTILGPTGAKTVFDPVVSSSGPAVAYAGGPWVTSSLAKSGTNNWVFTLQDQTVLTFDNPGSGDGRLRVMKTPEKFTTTYTYTGNDLTKIKDDKSGRELNLTWTTQAGKQLIATVTDQATPTNRRVSYFYDSAANLTDVEEVRLVGQPATASNRWHFQYDASHRLTNIRRPRQVADPALGTANTPAASAEDIVNVFDGQGRVTSQTDKRVTPNRVTTFNYSVPDQTTVTDPLGNVRVDFYNSAKQRTKVTAGTGSVLGTNLQSRVFTYDALGGIKSEAVVTSLSPYTEVVLSTTTRDASGFTQSATQRVDATTQRTVSSTYDTTGNPLLFGLPLTVTDSAAVVTTFTYDNYRHVLSACTPILPGGTGGACTNTAPPGALNPAEAWTTFEYDTTTLGTNGASNGDEQHVADLRFVRSPQNQQPSGVRSEFTYSPATGDRLTSKQAYTGAPVGSVTYDNVGRILTSRSPKNQPSGPQTVYVSDVYGRVTKTTNPVGSITERSFGREGQVDWVKDALSPANTTTFVYEKNGEPKQTIRPIGTQATAFWADGSLKSQTDPAGNITNYTYSPTGQLISEAAPGGVCSGALWALCTKYGYDAFGRVKTREAGNTAASTTTYGYDDASELTSVNYGDTTPDVTLVEYDTVSRRTKMNVTGLTQATWSWDSLSRLTGTVDGNNTAVGYGWDANSNLTKIAYPGGNCGVTPVKCVTRVFDSADRMTSITDLATPVNTTSFTPDANGNYSTINFPGVGNTDVFTFDTADRLVDVSATTAIAFKSNNTAYATLGYTRDANSNIKTETSTGLPGQASTWFGYDANQRLCYSSNVAGTGTPTCAAPPTGASNLRTWSFDTADNPTKLGDNTGAGATGQQFNPANQLCYTQPGVTGGAPAACAVPPAAATGVSSDIRGNRTTVTPPTGGTSTTLGYDLANRLTTVDGPRQAGNQGEYTPTNPYRAASSITGVPSTGFPVGKFTGGQTKSLTVTGGSTGVPASGVAAVVVNVSAANAAGGTGTGFLTAFSSDLGPPPAVSTLNYTSATISNLALVKVGADGKIKLYNSPGSVQVDVIVDIQGWYSAATGTAGGTFTPTNPTRITDTRAPGIGVPVGKIAAGQSLSVPICGQGPLPVCSAGSTTVGSVAVNVTVPTPAATGFLTLYAGGQALPNPLTNNTSFTAGQTTAEFAVVKVETTGADTGKIKVYNGSGQPVDVIIDVAGWTSISETATGSDMVLLNTPARIYDTRTGSSVNCAPTCGPFTANTTRNVKINGQGGLPTNGITAVMVNVTATSYTAAGFVSLYPGGTALPSPLTSNLNYSLPNAAMANAAIAKVGADGTINVYVGSQASDVIVDVTGYFSVNKGTWTYTYDGAGNRITKTCNIGCVNTSAGNNTTVTKQVWSQTGGLPMLLTETSGTSTTHIIYGPDGLPFEQTDGTPGGTYFYHHDQLGSTRAVTNTAGVVQGTWSYSPQGTVTATGSGPWNTTGTGITPKLGWAAEQRDAETGFVYLRARYYDPTTAQFLTRDPINPITREAYGYVGGNPLNATDPSGLWCIGVFSVGPGDGCDEDTPVGMGAKGGKQNKKSNEFVYLTDQEVSDRLRDPNTPTAEKQRLITEEKGRRIRRNSQNGMVECLADGFRSALNQGVSGAVGIGLGVVGAASSLGDNLWPDDLSNGPSCDANCRLRAIMLILTIIIVIPIVAMA